MKQVSKVVMKIQNLLRILILSLALVNNGVDEGYNKLTLALPS